MTHFVVFISSIQKPPFCLSNWLAERSDPDASYLNRSGRELIGLHLQGDLALAACGTQNCQGPAVKRATMRIAKTGYVFGIGVADSGQFAGAFHMKLNLAHKVRDRRIVP